MNSFSWNGIVKCIVFLQDKVQKGFYAFSSSPGGNGSNTHFCREMGYVAITRFFRSCLLRFDSDIWDLTQIWLRYLNQKTAVGASGLKFKVTCGVLDREWFEQPLSHAHPRVENIFHQFGLCSFSRLGWWKKAKNFIRGRYKDLSAHSSSRHRW